MDFEYQILNAIDQAGGSVDYVDLLNSFHKEQSTPFTTTHDLLKSMRERNLISGTLQAYSTVKITHQGTALLVQTRQDAKQEAIEKRSNRHFQIWMTVLGAVGSFVVGILVEYFGNFVSALLSLFA